ncbi:MAG: hypothetical protein CTY29_08570 [Methylobacter sp.]|nr:MAG: hypothetical protein CTY29_08570 [Methylobacter sp.]PPD23483.1 MAG: hypothetical protein CTY24_04265 [Methylobacter sp.]
MLYVVEIPNEGRPKSWFAFDEADLIRKVHAAKTEPYPVVFAQTTARQQLDKLASDNSPELEAERSQLQALGDQFGWDTALFRADYLLGPAVYQTEAVNELEACVTALNSDLKTCRIYGSETTAVNALYHDPMFDPYKEFYNHMALREQLIAMEVISDDL